MTVLRADAPATVLECGVKELVVCPESALLLPLGSCDRLRSTKRHGLYTRGAVTTASSWPPQTRHASLGTVNALLSRGHTPLRRVHTSLSRWHGSVSTVPASLLVIMSEVWFVSVVGELVRRLVWFHRWSDCRGSGLPPWPAVFSVVLPSVLRFHPSESPP